MFNMLSRNWWQYAVRGLFAIIFGILALVWPVQAILALVLLFGAYALVDGFFAVFTGIASRSYFKRWWAVLLEGVAGILIGVLTFFWPNITALVLLYFIAAWALITGIFELVAAIQLRGLHQSEWLLILGGLLSIVFGVLLFVFPGVGALSVIWLIGFYAIVFGISEIIFAFSLHGTQRDLEKAGKPGQ